MPPPPPQANTAIDEQGSAVSATKRKTRSLVQRGAALASAEAQRAVLRRLPLDAEFEERLRASNLWPLRPTRLEVLQLNVGKLCNQTCRHCHVDAGPDRTEVMDRTTMQLCLDALGKSRIDTVDITGGAPELNPNFRWLVQACRGMGLHVIHRCNLTLLDAPAYRDLPEFFARNEVEVVCSLPHFRSLATDAQRGEGVFERSIRVLKRLNEVGYGRAEPGRRLVLVTNPAGAFMPGPQASLEADWKRELRIRHGIGFDALFTITNMPISRYLEWLLETNNLETYMQQLLSAFNPAAAPGVMCRNTLSVGWDGQLYDCDFNQMLELGLDKRAPQHIRDFDPDALDARAICTGRHCFGCTAGGGSSCGGSTAT